MSIATLPLSLIALVAIAALVGAVRAVRHAPRRRVAWAIAQLVLGAALAAVLAWPDARTAQTIVVLSDGAADFQRAGDRPEPIVVALPGARAPAGVEQVPDLATALRRHAGTQALEVRGNGLRARDRDAARGLVLGFVPAKAPEGIVALRAAPRVREGRAWIVRGRARGTAEGRVELLGPGDVVLASAPLADDGRFTVTAHPKVPGPLDAALRVVDSNGAERDRAPAPVFVDPGAKLRIAVVAGAPSPDLKYLRRWASDAGHTMRTRVALSPGIALRDAPLVLDAATLAELDVVVVDERGFAALAPHERDALDEAVRGGLGLLLRATGPVPDDVAQSWAGYGWKVAGTGNALPTQLRGVPPGTTGPRRFERADISFGSDDAAPLLVARDRIALARWRVHGLGRVGSWTLVDAYRLALAGDEPRFGSLWARVIETLARAHGQAMPTVSHGARLGERMTLCGIAAGASVAAPDGSSQALLPEPPDSCAAFWPSATGWHALVDGERRVPFAVMAGDAGANIQASARRAATRALARATPASGNGPAAIDWRTRAAWALVALFAVAWWSEKRA